MAGSWGWIRKDTVCCCSRSPWKRIRRRRESRPIKPITTPLPWTKLLVVCSVLYANQFGIFMVFPFLPFMIHDFFPYLDKTELGNKAGYLGSAYFIGNFTGSLLWGWISDKIGRRPVLLMGMLGTLATELLFGFSQNFAWAIAARFLWGLLNGNLGVAKTYISEICDDTNQAGGFAAVGTTTGMARVSGSVIGGYLAQPASKFGPLKRPFFCKYPYSLPCIVGGTLAIVSFIAGFFLLEETLHTKKRSIQKRDGCEENSSSSSNTRSTNLETNDSSGSLLSNDSGIELKMNGSDSDTELIDITQSEIDDHDDEVVMMESDIDTDSDFEQASSDTELLSHECRTSDTYSNRSKSSNFVKRFVPSCLIRECGPQQCYGRVRNSLVDSYGCVKMSMKCLKECGKSHHRKRSWTLREVRGQSKRTIKRTRQSVLNLIHLILLDRRVFLSTLLYGVFAFFTIITIELVPLLLVTDHDSGGYNMDDSEIGVVLMSVAVIQLLWLAFVFPRIAKCLGFRYTFLLGVLLFGSMSCTFPFANKITGPIEDNFESAMDAGSGSGLNSSELFSNTSIVDELDFCGDNMSSAASANLVNENSVKRVPAKVWITLILIVGIWLTSQVTAFNGLMVMISNSSLTETRGTVNGYGQALCAIGRGLGPVVGATAFAWSENTGKGWPLNHHFVFDLTAVGAVIVIIISLLLPKSIEMKRKREPRNSKSCEQTLVEEPNNSDSNCDQQQRTFQS